MFFPTFYFKSLIQSSALSSLLLIPSSVFFISDIAFFISNWFFFFPFSFFSFKYSLLLMLLQLSQFFSPLYPPSALYHPHPLAFPPLSSCPCVIHISSLVSLFPILLLTYPCPFYAYHLCFLFPVPSPYYSSPLPLKNLHVISISLVLFLF